jgi:hypothetical protein
MPPSSATSHHFGRYRFQPGRSSLVDACSVTSVRTGSGTRLTQMSSLLMLYASHIARSPRREPSSDQREMPRTYWGPMLRNRPSYRWTGSSPWTIRMPENWTPSSLVTIARGKRVRVDGLYTSAYRPSDVCCAQTLALPVTSVGGTSGCDHVRPPSRESVVQPIFDTPTIAPSARRTNENAFPLTHLSLSPGTLPPGHAAGSCHFIRRGPRSRPRSCCSR